MQTYKIALTHHFKKQIKSLLKKNRSLKVELMKVLSNFEKPKEISIGKGVYKLRVAGNSKGKSGGYRLYVLVIEFEGILAPVCIYSKNEQENLNLKELTYHLQKVNEELSPIA